MWLKSSEDQNLECETRSEPGDTIFNEYKHTYNSRQAMKTQRQNVKVATEKKQEKQMGLRGEDQLGKGVKRKQPKGMGKTP